MSARARGGFHAPQTSPGKRGSNEGQNPSGSNQLTPFDPLGKISSAGGVDSLAAAAKDIHPTENAVKTTMWGS